MKSNSTIFSNVSLAHNIGNYMSESLRTMETSSIWTQLLYKEVIPAVDPATGAIYSKSVKFSKPQGPGGVGSFSKSQWQNAEQPGNIGMMIPTGDTYILSTSFKYTTIGRTFQDSLVDPKDLYGAIKDAEMGAQITEALKEMTKAGIYAASSKIYAGADTKADFDALTPETITSEHRLKWKYVQSMCDSLASYVVRIRDNHERANADFVNAIRTITTAPTAPNSEKADNLVDMDKWHEAMNAFSKAWRTERWATPRFTFHGLENISHYASETINLEGITVEKPKYTELYSKQFKNQGSPMVVLTGDAGFRQLWEDPDFLAAIKVSGYQHEEGLSGRYLKYVPTAQAINVQGILIINMQQDEMKYGGPDEAAAVLGGGVSFGNSRISSGAVVSTAFTAIPGLNFITTAEEGIGNSKNGVRVTTKTFNDIDMIDRFGFREFATMLFAWDLVFLNPKAFLTLMFLEDAPAPAEA